MLFVPAISVGSHHFRSFFIKESAVNVTPRSFNPLRGLASLREKIPFAAAVLHPSEPRATSTRIRALRGNPREVKSHHEDHEAAGDDLPLELEREGTEREGQVKGKRKTA